ncbi:hypothetical protein C6A85_77300, partial [Mycobacterium sp. ITM-2017-0098]
FDGRQWTDHYAAQVDPSQLPPPQGISPTGTTGASSVRPRQIARPERTVTKKRNPLFLVLAVLSAFPTAFFGLLYLNSQSNFSGLLLIFSFIWTWVWWTMSDRYR